MASSEIRQNTRQKIYDEHLLGIYRKRSENLVGHKIEFLKQIPCEEKKELALFTATLTGHCMATGAFLGAGIGFGAGIPAGPPGIAIGTGIGAAIGAATGGIVGLITATAINVDTLCDNYKKWLTTQQGKEFGREMKIFLEKYDEFSHVCNITDEIPIDAVRTPTGQLYERAAIMQWIEEHGTDPRTRTPLKASDLKDDNEITLNSSKQLTHIIEEDVGYLEKACPEIVTGLKALNKDLQGRNIRAHNIELAKLQKEFTEDRITHAEFQKRKKQLDEKYGS